MLEWDEVEPVTGLLYPGKAERLVSGADKAFRSWGANCQRESGGRGAEGEAPRTQRLVSPCSWQYGDTCYRYRKQEMTRIAYLGLN